MIASAFFLGLLGLAVASPMRVPTGIAARARASQISKGFRLVVNVTDPSRDFETPIQNYYIASIHTGAGLALVGVNSYESTGRIFYQNGTEEEYQASQATTITDGGTPLFPVGLKLTKDEESPVSVATLDNGPGTPGIQVSALKKFTYLLPETFFACNEPLAYYGGKKFIVIKQTNFIKDVPEDCAPIRLIPECAELEDLPEGSLSSHDFALDTRCYNDVKGVNWDE
ncbi:hypothetical protein B0T10DRAFT_269189 [Thelonectria olida]|uniref:DUF7907 domain-containing protein n=1 Tax=Thelonectria olida TaxID=1576542 RepID=A0A9P9AUW3_9HYPO|nr:hypothetical protein B0T10DRAFT_269189 [Thelonectria olida]